jgi:hypothetical protein
MVEEDSLTGEDIITIHEHRGTVSNPTQTIVTPYCNLYWNRNKKEG